MSRKVLLLLLYGHTRILDFAAKKVLLAADLTKGVQRNCYDAAPLARKIKKFTVNRSPHVDKRSRESFEWVMHYRRISVEADAETCHKFRRFVAETMPPGVSVKVTERSFEPLQRFYTPQPVAGFQKHLSTIQKNT